MGLEKHTKNAGSKSWHCPWIVFGRCLLSIQEGTYFRKDIQTVSKFNVRTIQKVFNKNGICIHYFNFYN